MTTVTPIGHVPENEMFSEDFVHPIARDLQSELEQVVVGQKTLVA